MLETHKSVQLFVTTRHVTRSEWWRFVPIWFTITPPSFTILCHKKNLSHGGLWHKVVHFYVSQVLLNT